MLVYSINILNRAVYLLLACVLCSGCEKWLTAETPSTQIDIDDIFATDAAALSTINGIYSQLSSTEIGIANGGMTLICGLLSDELLNYSSRPDYVEFFNNNVTPPNNTIRLLWSEAYQNIYAANLVLEQLDRSPAISDQVRHVMKGEALFLRAFLHFNLLQLFGGVPYIKVTDYKENNTAPRMATSQVYSEIIADLTAASLLLGDDYPTGEKTRPNKTAVHALLARVHLYAGNWVDAITYADSVLSANNYHLTAVNDVFLKNSDEAIWQLMPVLPERNANEGYYFARKGRPLYASLRPQFLSHYDSIDLRKQNWSSKISVQKDSFYYPNKYKINSGSDLLEYCMVLRLSEQFLIRAEAKARLAEIDESIEDINALRDRAGLPLLASNDVTDILDQLLLERSREMLVEWGHRWFDLKRFGRSTGFIGALKPGWTITDTILPIPQLQIQNSTNFPQNPGY